MLVAAVMALASRAPALEDPKRPILPDVEDVREISVEVAKGVIKCAVREGLAQEEGIPASNEELEQWVRVQMWEAKYRPLVKVGGK